MGIAVKIYDAFKEDENKAKVLLEVVEELENRIPPDISTKADLELTKLALQKEIEDVRANLIKWVAGLMVVQTGVIVSLRTLLR